jgi:hypothetical protein
MDELELEIKLRWRVRCSRKNGKEYCVYRITVRSPFGKLLSKYVPYLNLREKIIEFKPKSGFARKGIRERLKWSVITEKKNGKTFTEYYIAVKSDLVKSLSLLDLDPYLDLEKMVITFRPKQVQVNNIHH